MRSPFHVPEPAPSGPLEVLLAAQIAYKSEENGRSGGKAEHHASYRYVEQMFRVSNSAVERALRHLRGTSPLVSEPWIRISTPARGADGHKYAFAESRASSSPEWEALGKALFGSAGILTEFLFRPILLPPGRGVGLRGALVLGTVNKFSPITKKEVGELLRGFMNAKTTAHWLNRLLGVGLVIEERGEYHTPKNLWTRIRSDELAFGAAHRAREIDTAIGLEQYRHQTESAGGKTLGRVYSTLKKQPCFYCATVPRPEGGDVEHFPPVHWGGSDETSLLLAACRTCNGSHGAILGRTPRVEPPEPSIIEVRFPGSAEAFRKFMLEAMMTRAAHYAALLNDGFVDEAQDAALSLFPAWIALKRGVTVVDTTLGEIATAAEDHDTKTIAVLNDEIGGIPEHLGGTRGRRK